MNLEQDNVERYNICLDREEKSLKRVLDCSLSLLIYDLQIFVDASFQQSPQNLVASLCISLLPRWFRM